MQIPKDPRDRDYRPGALASYRDEYQKQKDSRNERFQKLQQERARILQERQRLQSRIRGEGLNLPHSRQSDISLNAAVDKAREKIPQFERRVRTLKDEEERKRRLLTEPYRGELGIGSYEPWQLEDFYFMREFVRSWVDEVVDFIVFEPSSDTKKAIESLATEFQKQLDIEQSEIQLSEAIRDVQFSIVEEATSELLDEVTSECLTVHFQARQAVTNIIIDAVTPSDLEENTKSLITSAYQQMKKEHSKRENVWQHSQKLHFVGDETTEKPTTAEEEVFDGIILSFNGITPYDETPNNMLAPNFKVYRDAESHFWMGYTPILSSLPLPRRYKGVSCTALSSDHSLVAVSTVQGDIAVWDLSLYPPRVLRACKGGATIKHIHWSLDSSQILTLNLQGVTQLWSLRNSVTASYDVRGFEPIEQNLGFKASELVNILTLEPRDLFFSEGSFKSSTELIGKPICVTFHPSLSFFGKQVSIMVGMETGTILKLCVKNSDCLVSFPKVQPNNDIPNKIGKGIEAELFKSHKHPIQLIDFVKDSMSMVTVDDHGFIYLWDYTEESLSGFGWFSPVGSYQLDMAELTYHPASGTVEKIEFIDTVKGTGRIKELNRQDMIKKRKEVQTFINSLRFGKPWKSDDKDKDKVTHVYAPRNVPHSGATFHCITYYRENKKLAQYATQLYKPVRFPCVKLMSCQVNPSRDKLVFSLLFNQVLPKEYHITFVTINLKAMKVSRNLIEFPLTDTEYKQCEQNVCCSFDISKVIDATGSEYMMTSVCGNVSGFSMTTGNIVMASSQENWIGCHLNEEQASVSATTQVRVVGTVSGLMILFYAPKQNTLNLLHMKDQNMNSKRHITWQAYCNLQTQDTGPYQQVLRRKQWTITGHPDSHIKCTMETIILNLIDDVIQLVDGPFSDPDAEANALENRQWPFERHSK